MRGATVAIDARPTAASYFRQDLAHVIEFFRFHILYKHNVELTGAARVYRAASSD
jgi:hypothetical protein